MKCENLDVWKNSCNLSIEIYKYFNGCRDYSFKDQITRSSLSIASNIAEGMEKESNKEKVRFLEISKGSAAELLTQIYIGIKVNYIDENVGLRWKKELTEILSMLSGLQKYLRS